MMTRAVWLVALALAAAACTVGSESTTTLPGPDATGVEQYFPCHADDASHIVKVRSGDQEVEASLNFMGIGLCSSPDQEVEVDGFLHDLDEALIRLDYASGISIHAPSFDTTQLNVSWATGEPGQVSVSKSAMGVWEVLDHPDNGAGVRQLDIRFLWGDGYDAVYAVLVDVDSDE